MGIGYSGAPRVTQNNMESRLRRLSRSLTSGNNGTPLKITLRGGANTNLIEELNFEAAPGAANTSARRPVWNVFSSQYRSADNTAVVNAGVIAGSWNTCGFLEVRCHTDNTLVWGVNNTFGGGPGAVVYMGSTGYMKADNTAFFYDETNDELNLYTNSTQTTPMLKLEQDGTGDAFVNFSLTGVDDWSIGVDNSDGDKLKIANGPDLVTNTRMTLTPAGQIIMFPDASQNVRMVINGGTAANLLIDQLDAATATSDASLWFRLFGVQSWAMGIDNSDSDSFKISPSTTVGDNTLVITTGGSVGIGTNSPGQTLDVRGNLRAGSNNAGTNRYFEIRGGTSDAVLDWKDTDTSTMFEMRNDNGVFRINRATNSDNALTIESGGNVGVKKTAPDTDFHVYENTSGVTPTVIIEQDGTGDSSMRFMLTAGQGYTLGIDNSDSDRFKISLGNTITDNTFVIDPSTGHIGLGTTTESTARLYINRQAVSAANATYASFLTYIPGAAVDANSTNNYFGIRGAAGTATYDIGIGFTDSGSRIACRFESHVTSANFQGTLASQEGLRVSAGHTAGTGTISNSVALKIQNLASGGATLTQSWGLYQTGAAARNFFAGNLGVGIAPATGAVTFNVGTSNTAATPNVWIRQQSTGDCGIRFSIGTATANFSAGIDNSDNDKFKISAGSTIGDIGIQMNAGAFVGIGDAAFDPAARLHVKDAGGTAPSISAGTMILLQRNDTTGRTCNYSIIGGTAGFSAAYFGDSDSETSGGIIYDHSNDYFNFRTDGSSGRAYLSGTGLGIAVEPSFPLHVYRNDTSVNPTVRIEQDGTGDCTLNFNLTSTQGWAFGIDNDDADRFRISTGNSVTHTDNFIVMTTDKKFGIGNVPNVFLHQYSNDASTTPAVQIEQDGTGDAAVNFRLTSTLGVSMGIDNGSDDNFMINPGNTIAASAGFIMNTSNLSFSMGTTTDARYMLRILPPSITATSGRTISAFAPRKSVAANSTNIFVTYYADTNVAGAYDIASGIVDSGSREAFRSESYASNADFLGTLASQKGLYSRTGISVGSGTITNSIGLDLEMLESSGTITTGWGVYQRTANANNYFAGDVGIGGEPDGGQQLRIYRNDTAVTSQVEIEQDSTGDATMTFTLSGGQQYSLGIDNSDSDRFRIHPGNTLAASTHGIHMTTAGRVGIGDQTSDGNWLYVVPDSETSTGTRASVKAELPKRAVDANESNFYFGFHSEWQPGTFDIGTGFTDSGSREGFRCEAFVNDSTFAGTLTTQKGLSVRTGHASGASTNTAVITNSIGVFVENLRSGAVTVTNEWGIYQATAAASNQFNGNTTFYRNDSATGPQVTIEQDSTGDAALNFLLTSTAGWTAGIDNSDSDKFKISLGNTASANTFVINGSSDVGIGTSPDASVRLHVLDNGAGDSGTWAMFENGAGSNGGVRLELNRSAASRAAQIVLSNTGTPVWYFGILRDGGSSEAGFAISSGSDINVTTPVFYLTTGGNIGYNTSQPTSKVHYASSSVGYTIGYANTTTTLGDGSHHVLVDLSSNPSFTMTLPSASTCVGREYVIKKVDSSANTVTIDGNGAQTIDGAANTILNTQYQYVRIISDGSNWFITGSG